MAPLISPHGHSLLHPKGFQKEVVPPMIKLSFVFLDLGMSEFGIQHFLVPNSG